jgi:hypothetical protein
MAVFGNLALFLGQHYVSHDCCQGDEGHQGYTPDGSISSLVLLGTKDKQS